MENQINSAQNTEPMLSAPQNIALESPRPAMRKKDSILGILCGLLIGLMAMPVLKMAKPDLYESLRIAIIPFFTIGAPLGLYFSSLIAKKIAVIWQLAKFVVTGVMNVLVDFGTLAIVSFLFSSYLGIKSDKTLISIGLVISFYTLFKAISFIVANINSYFWNKYWTFEQKEGKTSQFFQFFIVSVVGFIVNVAVASIVFRLFNHAGSLTIDQWGLVGAAFGSIAGLAWNFLGYKFIVFKK